MTVAMAWLCQLFSSLGYYVRVKKLFRVFLIILLVVSYCEFFHYYVVVVMCTWPRLSRQNVDHSVLDNGEKPLRVMILGDTHLLGFREGHWFDKLRREWQMVRSFQASLAIHSPDVVFILGDLLDEGKWAATEEFQYHVERFHRMFKTSSSIKSYIVVGNHDVGFHEMMTDKKEHRFEVAFDAPSARMLTINGNIFVLINSMALEGDKCNICSETEKILKDISWRLKCAKGWSSRQSVAAVCDSFDVFTYSRPILMQHFPMYRASDVNCTTADAAPPKEREKPFRQKYDCLSKEATEQLFEWINPRVIFDAHTHHGCYRVHSNGIPEWTVASFSWRNKPQPTFLLSVISNNNYAVHQCFLPHEHTVIFLYIIGFILVIISLIIPRYKLNKTGNGFVPANKSN